MNPSSSARCLVLLALLGLAVLTRPPAVSAQPPLPAACDGLETLEFYTKPTLFRDQVVAINGLDEWRVRGQFIASPSFTFSPSTHGVRVILSQDTDFYDKTLAGSNFAEKAGSRTTRWQFRLLPPQPDVAGAEGWRFARFRQVPSKVGPSNRVRFSLGGNNIEMPIEVGTGPGGQTILRETLVFGDQLCITSVVTCIVRNEGRKLRCFSIPE